MHSNTLIWREVQFSLPSLRFKLIRYDYVKYWQHGRTDKRLTTDRQTDRKKERKKERMKKERKKESC